MMSNFLSNFFSNWFHEPTHAASTDQVANAPANSALSARIAQASGQNQNCGVNCLQNFVHCELLAGHLDTHLTQENYKLLLDTINEVAFNGETAKNWEQLKAYLKQNLSPKDRDIKFGDAYRAFLAKVLQNDANYIERTQASFFIPELRDLLKNPQKIHDSAYADFFNSIMLNELNTDQAIDDFLQENQGQIATYWQNGGFEQYLATQIKAAVPLGADELNLASNALNIDLHILQGNNFAPMWDKPSGERPLLELVNREGGHYELLLPNAALAQAHNQYYTHPTPLQPPTHKFGFPENLLWNWGSNNQPDCNTPQAAQYQRAYSANTTLNQLLDNLGPNPGKTAEAGVAELIQDAERALQNHDDKAVAELSNKASTIRLS
jgi:hypothetical protein